MPVVKPSNRPSLSKTYAYSAEMATPSKAVPSLRCDLFSLQALGVCSYNGDLATASLVAKKLLPCAEQ